METGLELSQLERELVKEVTSLVRNSPVIFSSKNSCGNLFEMHMTEDRISITYEELYTDAPRREDRKPQKETLNVYHNGNLGLAVVRDYSKPSLEPSLEITASRNPAFIKAMNDIFKNDLYKTYIDFLQSIVEFKRPPG